MSILDFVLLRYIKNELTDSNLYYGDSNCKHQRGKICQIYKKRKNRFRILKLKLIKATTFCLQHAKGRFI